MQDRGFAADKARNSPFKLKVYGFGAAQEAHARQPVAPFVQAARAESVKVKLNRKVMYELDGGDRTKTKSFKAKVEPAAVTLCVPRS